MAFPAGAGVPPEQLLALLGAEGGMDPMGPTGPMDQMALAPEPSPGTGGASSAVSSKGYSTLPTYRERQYGIPVEHMTVSYYFFIQMRDHYDAMV